MQKSGVRGFLGVKKAQAIGTREEKLQRRLCSPSDQLATFFTLVGKLNCH